MLAACGDVLAFLDDDDRWAPKYPEAALRRIEAGAEVVTTWIQVFHGTLPNGGFEVQPGLQAADVLGRNPGVTGSNLVLQRDAFATIRGFDDRLWVSNDKDFFIRWPPPSACALT